MGKSSYCAVRKISCGVFVFCAFLRYFAHYINMINTKNSQNDAQIVVAASVSISKPDFEWVCNECNFPNFTSSVSEDEIDMELHACIHCGGFEMHKRYLAK